MTEKSIQLYNYMVAKGYPEAFSELIAKELNSDFTAGRMIGYLTRGEHSLEDVADEMLAILSDRDRIRNKHVSEYAQSKINDLYRNFNGEDDMDI